MLTPWIIDLTPFLVGVIALLDEPNVILKEFALQKLNEIVDEFWPEIADSVEKM